jgi:hypothetical protein
MTDIQENEIITAEVTPAAIVPMTTKDLQARIAEETEQRKLITDFIAIHMKEGVDYGTIKVKTRDGREFESKPSLFKPGSEKFCSLFHFRPTFERDNDTWEMTGKTPGLFCYKCELVSANGAVVGEGRGAAHLSERQGWTVNNAIKIAEKRAQIDAVLRTGGLSDFFTQDIEDMVDGQQPKPQPQRPPQPENRPEPTNTPLQGQATENQKRAIFGSLKRLGISAEEMKARFSIEHVSQLSKQQASELIDKLYKMEKKG